MPLRSHLAAAGIVAITLAGAGPAAASINHSSRAARAHRHHAPARSHATVVGVAPSCAAADLDTSQAAPQALRDAVVCLVNQERARFHLRPLRESGHLDQSAQGWSDWMVRNSTFAHVVGGDTPVTRIRAAGYDWWALGENIATGFGTPRQAVQGWMASTGHCQNILDPQFVDVGTGINSSPVSGFASQPATWTQDFGLPAGGTPPSDNFGPAHGCPYNS